MGFSENAVRYTLRKIVVPEEGLHEIDELRGNNTFEYRKANEHEPRQIVR